MNTTVRCFRRVGEVNEYRRGVWLMTGEKRGAFFHGRKQELQPPEWDIGDFAHHPDFVVEITPEEALAEMDNGWPEAKVQMQKIFDRHTKGIQAGEGGVMDPGDDY